VIISILNTDKLRWSRVKEFCRNLRDGIFFCWFL